MGTLGAAGLQEKILGSKTVMVIRHSPVAVLCIPYSYEWSVPQKILLAINEEPKDLNTLHPLLNLCNLLKAKLQVAIVSEDFAEGADVMANSLLIQAVSEKLENAYPGLSFTTAHLTGEHFYEAIVKYMHENKVDLLAMIPRQKKWLQYITGRSMTQKLAAHSDVPLLALNDTSPL